MSLIVLGGRKNEVVCPHCGAPAAGVRRRSWVRPLWTGVAIVAALMAVTFVFMVMAVTTTAEREAATSTAGLMTRAEFSLQVRDKTMDQVRTLMGVPSYTQESGGRTYWYYNRKTYDYETKRPDRSVQVVFDYALVESVNFR